MPPASPDCAYPVRPSALQARWAYSPNPLVPCPCNRLQRARPTSGRTRFVLLSFLQTPMCPRSREHFLRAVLSYRCSALCPSTLEIREGIGPSLSYHSARKQVIAFFLACFFIVLTRLLHALAVGDFGYRDIPP